VPGIGAFISAGRSLEGSLERVRRADDLGFDSVYTTHIAARDSLSLLMAYASVSKRTRLGTGVAPIFSRTPVAMAQAAATIDEFYRSMLERSGFGEEIAAFDEGMQAGDVERAKAGLSDRLIGAVAGIGPASDVRATVERYREAGATSPCIGAIPGTDFSAALDAVAELI
jgi:alkanesulfonate monooxygenase SsuD/methylene tetrahydromethanopterin reductase-like flavin-dependent oxidoreductase (luciferase family)